MAAGALGDPDGLVRAAAVTLCGDGADTETIQVITALAVSDPVWQVRTRALDAIAGSDDPAVREAFVHALSDSVRHVRRAALRAGIEHPGLLPIDRLTSLVISDSDWENRVEAVRALGASKDPTASAGLDAAVADPNEFVRATAARERRELLRPGAAP
jgi:HEAT repeat protein